MGRAFLSAAAVLLLCGVAQTAHASDPTFLLGAQTLKPGGWGLSSHTRLDSASGIGAVQFDLGFGPGLQIGLSAGVGASFTADTALATRCLGGPCSRGTVGNARDWLDFDAHFRFELLGTEQDHLHLGWEAAGGWEPAELALGSSNNRFHGETYLRGDVVPILHGPLLLATHLGARFGPYGPIDADVTLRGTIQLELAIPVGSFCVNPSLELGALAPLNGNSRGVFPVGGLGIALLHP